MVAREARRRPLPWPASSACKCTSRRPRGCRRSSSTRRRSGGASAPDALAARPRARWGRTSRSSTSPTGRTPAPTPLVAAARAAGGAAVDGLEILARQGALSFTRWTGRDAPLEVMRARAPADRVGMEGILAGAAAGAAVGFAGAVPVRLLPAAHR